MTTSSHVQVKKQAAKPPDLTIPDTPGNPRSSISNVPHLFNGHFINLKFSFILLLKLLMVDRMDTG